MLTSHCAAAKTERTRCSHISMTVATSSMQSDGSPMTDLQSYEERISRLADARRKDSAAKRSAVIRAVNKLPPREDRHISRPL